MTKEYQINNIFSVICNYNMIFFLKDTLHAFNLQNWLDLDGIIIDVSRKN